MNIEYTPTKEIAEKVLKTVDAGLVNGLGVQEPGKMCIEAAVCFAFGLPHGDSPPCVGSAVRRFKIRLNDSAWPSNENRTKGMRKLAIAQLGSDQIDQREFAKKVALKTIQRIVPLAIKYHVQKNGPNPEVEALAKKCTKVKDLQKGRELCLEIKSKLYANAANAAAANAAAANAAAYAAYAAYAANAANAAAAAANAANAANAAAAAYAANAANAAAAAYTKATRLEALTTCAELGLEALIELKSPGCEWLYLCK